MRRIDSMTLVLCLLFLSMPSVAVDWSILLRTQQVQPITSETIVETALSALPNQQCLDYHIVGVCIFYVYPSGIQYSIKVGHRIPDLVVSVYNDIEHHPISDLGQTVVGATKSILESFLGVFYGNHGGRTEDPVEAGGEFRDYRNLIFREADLYGSPAVTIVEQMTNDYICPPIAVDPFMPYYLSIVDVAAWRDIDVRAIEWLLNYEFFLPLTREVGLRSLINPIGNTWGSVFPRIGYIVQSNEPKAAAVIAQRAGDIATGSDSVLPHIRIDEIGTGLTVSDGLMVWQPPKLKEVGYAKGDTGVFQMIYPVEQEDPVCEYFGEDDKFDLPGFAWADDKNRLEKFKSGDYVWNLWRPYECCAVKGIYIGSIDVIHNPEMSSTPSMPSIPGIPSLPSIPGIPSLPSLPGIL